MLVLILTKTLQTSPFDPGKVSALYPCVFLILGDDLE